MSEPNKDSCPRDALKRTGKKYFKVLSTSD